MGSESDKRDTERVLILGDLQGEIMVFEPLHIKEISRGGASVETRFPLHLNSLHDIRLTLGAKSVVLKGRVAHSRISDVDQDIVTYRTGIEFVDASDRVRSVISEFLETLKANRSGV
jgi:PilZ domain